MLSRLSRVQWGAIVTVVIPPAAQTATVPASELGAPGTAHPGTTA